MKKLDIGLVTDLKNYQGYFKRFREITEAEIIEVHLLEKDIGPGFSGKLTELGFFLEKEGVRKIAFHSPDGIMQTALFRENRHYHRHKLFRVLVRDLKAFSRLFNFETYLVVHMGVKVDGRQINTSGPDEIIRMRDSYLAKADEGYRMLIESLKGSFIRPLLENSPPLCASSGEIHLIDIAFEDIRPRIGGNGFVLDLSHAAICSEYFRQNNASYKVLDSYKKEYGGVPESLLSVESYIKRAAGNIRWIHLNDADGIGGDNEGRELGVENSIIDLRRIIKTITDEVKEPAGVIEILGSESDFSLIERSARRLLAIMDGH